MQQMGANSVNMDNDTESEDLSTPQASRGRNNSKLANKLVRSHAMREEASPPRDVLIAAAAAAAANTNQHGDTSPTALPQSSSAIGRVTSSPNTLSPPIQHRIRSPELGGGSSAHVQRGDVGGAVAHMRESAPHGNGNNPVLVLSPSVSPSEHETNTSTISSSPSIHTIQCSYHHQHQQCNHHGQHHCAATACNVKQSRSSPTNGNGGGMSPISTHRCCSPQQQQQQMLLTVDYVNSGDSGDDSRTSASHKLNKLNGQNLDPCANKQRNHNNGIIHEEANQHQTKAPKCECNITTINNNNSYQHHHQSSQADHQHTSNDASVLTHCNNANSVSSNNNNQLTVNRGNNRSKLRQQSSSQSYGSFDGSHSSLSLNASPCLSRDNSSEQYTDTTGVDLDSFIPETLNRNVKDRALMLRIEEELIKLAKDQIRTHYKFPPMSSYQRMLVHRCAAYFGMDHNIESSGKCVVVNRTKVTRIPNIPFKDHLRTDTYLPASNYSNNGSATGSTTSLANNADIDQQQQQHSNIRRSILKRGDNSGGSMDEMTSGGGRRDMMMLLSAGGSGDKRSKSFEEREEEYAKVRRRIFNPMIDHDHRGGSQDEFRWSDVRWPSTDSDVSTRNKFHPMEHYHPHRCRTSGRLQKVQSEEKGEDTLRPCVAKSYSFGGYGGCFTRGDSIMSTHSASPRLLTKQDSSSSSTYHHHHRQLSPSSSGYKTQSSQRSTESVTPSPTSTPYLPNTIANTSHRQDSTNTNVSSLSSGSTSDCILGSGDGQQPQSQQMVFWAVTDVDSVPRGSVIINPVTGMAVRNDDGTVYRYDPGNPPAAMGGGGGCGGGGEKSVEGAGTMGNDGKHTNYMETKMLLPEPLMEESPLCSNEVLSVRESPNRLPQQQQHGNGGKPPLSPSHYHNHNNLHHQHQQMKQQQEDVEQVLYQQEQQQDVVEQCQVQQITDSSQMMVQSPSQGSPQRRRKNSSFKKQENFAQASMDKPVMVSAYTSTTNSPSLPYTPPPVAHLPTPRPSRPSSVLSQQHSSNTCIQSPQQPRYGPTPASYHHPMPAAVVSIDQQQQGAWGPPQQPPMYHPSEGQTVVFGPSIQHQQQQQQQQQPCFVYGYGVPTAGYNPTGMEASMGEMSMNMGVGGYYITDGAGAAPIAYQALSPAGWQPNQPTISYFAAPGQHQGAAPPTMGVGPPPLGTTRFSVPMHAQTASFLAPSPYAPHHPATNYITCPAAAAAAAQLAVATHQPPATELIPLYPPVPPGQPTVLYSQHPPVAGHQGITGQLYPAGMYGTGNMPVPYTPPPQQTGPALLNAQSQLGQPPHQQALHQQYYSASSATSTPTGHGVGFTYPTSAPTPPTLSATVSMPLMRGDHSQGFGPQGIVHGIGGMSISGVSKGRNVHHPHNLDRRNSIQRSVNKMSSYGTSGQQRSLPGCSSQSSTEPSSPATTVVPSVYGGSGGYRLPSGADTPPIAAPMMIGAPQQFVQMSPQQHQSCSNLIIRPMSTVHSSPPMATMNRSSRSPTPAGSDVTFVGDRPKFPILPPGVAGVYHPGGMPFMIPADVRFGMRGQPGPFRQLSPHQRLQQPPGTDRGVRNRKPRGSRQYLPPNGRPNI